MSRHPDKPFSQWLPLAQPRLGTRVVYASDEFFGAKERLIEPAAPIFVPDRYDDHGKWMDGWETRRRRGPGHDHCILKLGIPGIVRGVDIDTSHFDGNHPPAASLDGCHCSEELPPESAAWHALLAKTPLEPDARHPLPVDADRICTHLRLNLFPDGGIARLRVYGEVQPDWKRVGNDEVVDLLAVENGGRALAASDEHFGSMHNLNVPGRGLNMGDGWETARRRGPGNDWCLLALGATGVIEHVEIDTAHFKGNYPELAALQAGHAGDLPLSDLVAASERWPYLLPASKLCMDKQHYFHDELTEVGAVNCLRLSIYPDGGVSRLRVFGRRLRD